MEFYLSCSKSTIIENKKCKVHLENIFLRLTTIFGVMLVITMRASKDRSRWWPMGENPPFLFDQSEKCAQTLSNRTPRFLTISQVVLLNQNSFFIMRNKYSNVKDPLAWLHESPSHAHLCNYCYSLLLSESRLEYAFWIIRMSSHKKPLDY